MSDQIPTSRVVSDTKMYFVVSESKHVARTPFVNYGPHVKTTTGRSVAVYRLSSAVFVAEDAGG